MNTKNILLAQAYEELYNILKTCTLKSTRTEDTQSQSSNYDALSDHISLTQLSQSRTSMEASFTDPDWYDII